MTILLDDRSAVQPEAIDAMSLADVADYHAWLDELDKLAEARRTWEDFAAAHHDWLWLKDEAQEAYTRSTRRPDPAGLNRAVSRCLCAARDSLAAYAARELALRGRSGVGAAALFADPTTREGKAVLAHYGHLQLPTAPARSKLGEALTTAAAWYLHLDTPAGDLAAFHLFWVAAEADDHQADTLDELDRSLLLEAQAQRDEVCGDQ